ncbi:hypothetical protein [Streptomyces gossypiisoli]|nr:hypothetical protein [Streptomyces gossypiisoli]
MAQAADAEDGDPPAQPNGAASAKESPSGIRMSAAAGTVMVVAQPPA